uniref:Fe2OG dioxygenase domain-containing protein n=1 Tax=Florenciella sp. virus SA2 TaxID=3240092 RepID=A0AB39JCC8_9VIRU
MNNFNFSEEMVYGKKHLCKLKYDISKYKFIEYVENLFGTTLDNLHNIQNQEYELFTKVGKDSNTEFHKKFYKKLNEGWDIQNEYDKFIKNEILPFLELNEAMVQKFPTFRVMLPNNVAIVVNHHDSNELYKHPIGEINFIMGLTNMYDSNTVNVETMPRLNEYKKIILNAGETICFNGNLCNHNNEINKTGKTRVSLDFRILPLNYYETNYNKCSATTNTKYIEGGYYKKVTLNT